MHSPLPPVSKGVMPDPSGPHILRDTLLYMQSRKERDEKFQTKGKNVLRVKNIMPKKRLGKNLKKN